MSATKNVDITIIGDSERLDVEEGQVLQAGNVPAAHVGDLVAAVHLELLQEGADIANDVKSVITDLETVIQVEVSLQVNTRGRERLNSRTSIAHW